MTAIVKDELDHLIDKEWEYLESRKSEWSLLEGEQDMEVLEHILRCILHMGRTTEYAADFQACAGVQNKDGGWSKQSHENRTSMWITTFVALKLCRGNMILKDSAIAAAIDRALAYVLSTQEKEGFDNLPGHSRPAKRGADQSGPAAGL
jgi:hypothetical protein